jgi:hypothetical protein
MSDPMSDVTFRPDDPPARRRRGGQAWEAVVREELLKLRRRSPAAPRVVPVRRTPETSDPDTEHPAA